ncbi:MAG: sensor histidine kinase, partial [Chloroflexota bacterium]
ANALARYVIGFPGAVLAAYGLREQAFRFIAPLDAPHIVATLRVAGVALLLYAVFGGLIPPPVPFFPGNVINARTFEQFLGLPPLIVLSLVGLLLAVTIIRALEIFDVETERRIEAMEQQQILAAERDRIGRDLHDGAIQTVYTAGLLVESAYKLAPSDGLVAARLEKAVAVLNDAIRDLRRNLGELRSAPSGEPLATALRRLAEDPSFRSLVEVSLELDLADSASLSPMRADHVLAIVGEALSNVIRHARAQRVRILARRADERLTLTIQDNGVGFACEDHGGYGLRNMRDRARLLGGQLDVTSASGKGTTLTLDIPWSDER